MDWIDTDNMVAVLKRFPDRKIETMIYRLQGKMDTMIWVYDRQTDEFVVTSDGKDKRIREEDMTVLFGKDRWLIRPFFFLTDEKEKAMAIRLVEELIMADNIDWVIEECGIEDMRTCQHCRRLINEGWWCDETWSYCSDECMIAENPEISKQEIEKLKETDGGIEWMEWKG